MKSKAGFTAILPLRVRKLPLLRWGGTVGDIESQPFLESIRQFQHERGPENVILIHVTLILICGLPRK